MEVSVATKQYNTRDYVKSLLENHHMIRSWNEQMKLRLQYLEDETLEETIESLTYPSSSLGDKVQASKNCDKTAIIASIYRHINWQVKNISYADAKRIISMNELALQQLDCAVEQLRERYKIAIIGIYYDRKTAWEIAEDQGWCEKTVYRNRDRGIEILMVELAL